MAFARAQVTRRAEQQHREVFVVRLLRSNALRASHVVPVQLERQRVHEDTEKTSTQERKCPLVCVYVVCCKEVSP